MKIYFMFSKALLFGHLSGGIEVKINIFKDIMIAAVMTF